METENRTEMARTKGTPKTGGRHKGTPNKATTDLKKWVRLILEDGKDEFVRRLDNLDDVGYIRIYTGLLGYVLPKMAATTPEDVLRREKEMFEELLLSMPEEMVDRVAERVTELNDKDNEDKTKQR